MLDETFTDFLDEMGMPTIPLFQTSVRDTGLEAKFKQMGDGLLLGGIISSIWDTARIYRFSRAFQRADDAEKKLIIKALNEEGERLGGSVARLRIRPTTSQVCCLQQVRPPQGTTTNSWIWSWIGLSKFVRRTCLRRRRRPIC